MNWKDRFLAIADAGFDFLEISIDESPERLNRLNWSPANRLEFSREISQAKILVPSMCLSAHRKFPLGSTDSALRSEALRIMERAIQLACDVGIRVIQLAGYDVYYEQSTIQTQQLYVESMKKVLELASHYQVMLAIEIMDTPFLSSIKKYLVLKEKLPSPWLSLYPDLGNLSAWGNDIAKELDSGIHHIIGVHIKDTLSVKPDFPGVFRNVPFGEGDVDFTLCFSALHRLGYVGPFLIEMWLENSPDPIKEIKHARAWVVEKLKSGGYS